MPDFATKNSLKLVLLKLVLLKLVPLKLTPLQLVLLTLALVQVLTWSSPVEAAGLTDRESDGYLQWLHSLEQAVAGRQKKDLDEGNLLYPFDHPGWQGIEVQPYRHLSIGKAVGELEREWLLRGETRIESPLVALANARNYLALSEFDSSLVWYDKARELDTEGNFSHEISREKMAAAMASRDSLAVMTCVTNTIGSKTVIGNEFQCILALRWLLVAQDRDTVDLVLRKIQTDGSNLTDRLRFWVAYSLAWRRQRDEAMAQLRILVQSGGLSRDLTEGQRAWVLLAIPDFLFLDGHHDASRAYYEILNKSSLPLLANWGGYQVANMDLLSGRYLRAGEGFKRICESQRQGSWQDHACEMVTIATEIERLKSEGESYGAHAFYGP